jgi:hypothetical protein
MTLLELCDALFNMQGASNSSEVCVDCYINLPNFYFTSDLTISDDEDLQRVRIVGLRLERPDSARAFIRLLTERPVQLKGS